MTKLLAYADREFDEKTSFETISAISNAAWIWYRVDLDPKYLDKTKGKTNYFPLGPEWKLLDVSISEDYMKNDTPRDYIFLISLIEKITIVIT